MRWWSESARGFHMRGFAVPCITTLPSSRCDAGILLQQGYCGRIPIKQVGKPEYEPLIRKNLVENEVFPDQIIGAGNEIRTRDLNLGKVALYQLSYSRMEWYDRLAAEKYAGNKKGSHV